MSRLTEPEKQALLKHVGQNVIALAIKTHSQNLEGMGQANLQAISNGLQGVNRMQPFLYSAKQKLQQALLHAKVPSKDPNKWPKAFRETKLVTGVEQGVNQRWIRRSEQAEPVRLNKLHEWKKSNENDLIIVGPVSSVIAGLKAARAFSVENQMEGSNVDSVNYQHDRDYGNTMGKYSDTVADLRHANALPTFQVTATKGSPLTNEVYTVVLDPAKDLVDLVGGAVAGFAGGFSAAAPAIIDILKTVNDVIGLADTNMAGAIGQDLVQHFQGRKNDLVTVTIGTVPYEGSIDTGLTKVAHDPLVAYVLLAVHRALYGDN